MVGTPPDVSTSKHLPVVPGNPQVDRSTRWRRAVAADVLPPAHGPGADGGSTGLPCRNSKFVYEHNDRACVFKTIIPVNRQEPEQ